MAICLRSEEDEVDAAEGAVVVPDEGGWVEADELVVGGRGGRPETPFYSHIWISLR